MLTYNNNGRLVQSIEELPDFSGCHQLFLDFETTSGHRSLDSLNPWFNCEIAGVGVTADDCPHAYYVPFRAGMPYENLLQWLRDTVTSCDEWVNHNVKYDAHVYANAIDCDLPRLVCTLILSKIIDSDRMLRGGYSLSALSKSWLHEDISKYEDALKPYLHRNKDYGLIPDDIIGEYGCQDVLTVRRLYNFVCDRRPPQCKDVWKTEIELTRVLFDMERYGMRVDPQELKLKAYATAIQIDKLHTQLEELVGRSFRPHVNEDCFDVLCNQFGLPVLDFTESGNPSFDKTVLASYQTHPQAPTDIVNLIIQARELATFYNFFLKPYQLLHIDGIMHPTYNQAVRTGRMSCSEPNAQQLNKKAKQLIHPREGNAYVAIDYSQIEFRIIVHYIKDAACIDAYQKDRRTDFHTWVAEMCGIPRRPAKTMNFMMGYGGGKEKTVQAISTNKHVVGDIMSQLEGVPDDQKPAVFQALCKRKGEEIYRRYHETLPGLKRTAKIASAKAFHRGYVYNLYGRHRHLPKQASHLAFNTLCQSSAADLMKERMVAAAEMCQHKPIRLVANVHDEVVFEAPIEVVEDPRVIQDLVYILEHPSIDLRVPICVDVGVSTNNWAEASGGAAAPPYDTTFLALNYLTPC